MQELIAWLPAGLGIWPAALLVVASFFTSALTAAFGVGGGLAMLALMGLFVPVAALIPVHGAVQLGSNSGRAWHQRAHVRLDIAWPFLAGSLVGAVAGAMIVVQLPDAVLKLLLGVFILVVTWAKVPGLATLGHAGMAVASAVLALTTMFVGATGPLLSSVLAQLIPNDRKALVATHGAAHDRPARPQDRRLRLRRLRLPAMAAADRADDRLGLPRHRLRHPLAGPAARGDVPPLVPHRHHAAGAGSPAPRLLSEYV